MSGNAPRSRSVLAAGLTGWFEARYPDWSEVVVAVDRPQPGLSSDTLMLEVSTKNSTEHFVARLPPLGPTLFPDYDLSRQVRVQNGLGARGVAAAPALALETDPVWIGTPFLIMPRIAGHTLTSNPAYVTHGWLAEQTAERQQTVVFSLIDQMASIHALQVDDLDLGDLTGGGPSLTGMIDYWGRFLDWATADSSATEIYRQGLSWCRENLPANPPPPSLLWGDPQLTNLVLADDGSVAALLDFEMAGYGPAEVDLAWFLVLHEQAGEMVGVNLAGDPGRAAIIARHEAAVGRAVTDFEWYEVLANIRSGALVLRIGELMTLAGHSAGWTTLVPQPRHVARLIGA